MFGWDKVIPTPVPEHEHDWLPVGIEHYDDELNHGITRVYYRCKGSNCGQVDLDYLAGTWTPKMLGWPRDWESYIG